MKPATDVPGKKLKTCGRCTGVWYCGRECQLGGWKAGHKIDCCKQNASVEAALLELVEV